MSKGKYQLLNVKELKRDRCRHRLADEPVYMGYPYLLAWRYTPPSSQFLPETVECLISSLTLTLYS